MIARVGVYISWWDFLYYLGLWGRFLAAVLVGDFTVCNGLTIRC